MLVLEIIIATLMVGGIFAGAGRWIISRIDRLERKNDYQHLEASEARTSSEHRLIEKIDAVHGRVDAVDEKIHQVDTKLVRVEAKFEHLDERSESSIEEWRKWRDKLDIHLIRDHKGVPEAVRDWDD